MQARIIASTFPDRLNNISEINNRLYWRTLNSDEINNIEIEPGFYESSDIEQIVNENLSKFNKQKNNNSY